MFADARDACIMSTRPEPKTVPPAFLSRLPREWKRPAVNLQLKCDVPNQIMNAWQGDLVVERTRENVNLGNFLLTDSVLRSVHSRTQLSGVDMSGAHAASCSLVSLLLLKNTG